MQGWAIGIRDDIAYVRGEGVSCPIESWSKPHRVRDASCGWRMIRIASSAKNASMGDRVFTENIDPAEDALWKRTKDP